MLMRVGRVLCHQNRRAWSTVATTSSIATSLRAPSSAEISWTLTTIRPDGSVHTSTPTFAKLAFCKQHHLQPRDLRKLDAKYADQYPAILPRNATTILCNLHNVRALVHHDSVTLFNAAPLHAPLPVHHDDLVAMLSQKLAMWSAETRALRVVTPATPSSTSVEMVNEPPTLMLPFEFVALETILQSVVASLDEELRALARPIESLVQALVRGEQGDPARQRDHLADLYSNVQMLSSFEKKVSNTRDMLKDLTETDEDLNDLHLTELAKRDEVDNHDDLEVLLETYLSYIEELLDTTTTMLQTVTATERLLTLTLDFQRNALLIVELRFAMLGVAMTSGALLASLFGMNLYTGMEEDPLAFGVVCTLTGAIAGGVLGSGMWRMRAVTRQARLPANLLPHPTTLPNARAMQNHRQQQLQMEHAAAAQAVAAGAAAARRPQQQPSAFFTDEVIRAALTPFSRTRAPRFEFGHRLRDPPAKL
ncbi:hypothetical protein BC828DRAFT_394130 [Blastocladiella britannica]|nr:hypothetical protein BC828DRAFT_394130 [Blastocladiella britannica]